MTRGPRFIFANTHLQVAFGLEALNGNDGSGCLVLTAGALSLPGDAGRAEDLKSSGRHGTPAAAIPASITVATARA